MTRKPTRNYSLGVVAASVATASDPQFLTLLSRFRLEIRVTGSANKGGGDYGHLR